MYVPAFEAVTTHVYVATLEFPVGPVLLAQVMPVTPAIDQDAVPEGVIPEVGPVTVAVKVKFEEREVVAALVVILTEGLNFETESVPEEVGATPL